jgi:CRISPR-associated exonuclease Cas4
MLFIGIAFGLLLLAFAGWLGFLWQRNRSGLPEGRLIFIDTGKMNPPEGALFSPNYSLTGRPDFLVHQGGEVIPIEVKSAAAPAYPYPSHIFQLAAYLLLVEEHFGGKPPFGILKYRDRSLQIPFTPKLKEDLIRMLAAMREDARSSNLDRSHEDPGRCRRCGFRSACGQSLAA